MTKRTRQYGTSNYDSNLRYAVALWREEDDCCESGWVVLTSSNSLYIARSTCRYRKQQHPINKYVVIDRKTGKVKIWRYFMSEDDSYSYSGDRINELEEAFNVNAM